MIEQRDAMIERRDAMIERRDAMIERRDAMIRTQNSLFRSVRPGDSTLRRIGVAIMRVTFCDIHYSLLMQFT